MKARVLRSTATKQLLSPSPETKADRDGKHMLNATRTLQQSVVHRRLSFNEDRFETPTEGTG